MGERIKYAGEWHDVLEEGDLKLKEIVLLERTVGSVDQAGSASIRTGRWWLTLRRVHPKLTWDAFAENTLDEVEIERDEPDTDDDRDGDEAREQSDQGAPDPTEPELEWEPDPDLQPQPTGQAAGQA